MNARSWDLRLLPLSYCALVDGQFNCFTALSSRPTGPHLPSISARTSIPALAFSKLSLGATTIWLCPVHPPSPHLPPHLLPRLTCGIQLSCLSNVSSSRVHQYPFSAGAAGRWFRVGVGQQLLRPTWSRQRKPSSPSEHSLRSFHFTNARARL
jgi:hypothetical protein